MTCDGVSARPVFGGCDRFIWEACDRGCGAPPSTPADQSVFAPGSEQQRQQQQQPQVYPGWGGESQFLPNQGGPAVMGTGGQGGFWTPGGASGGEEGQPLPSRDSEENRGFFGGLFR